jgi:hypothetical protein
MEDSDLISQGHHPLETDSEKESIMHEEGIWRLLILIILSPGLAACSGGERTIPSIEVSPLKDIAHVKTTFLMEKS